ncbi:MAG TPA: response regulator transcription factor [Egicoccus sp.]|nr:response regulator transcription factor [Egicoccus sp.]HSK21693.1 response regulator transcription factor [Egicoccus sp.]
MRSVTSPAKSEGPVKGLHYHRPRREASKDPDVIREALRVLIVDDHRLAREGIRSMLASDPLIEFCAEAGDVASARVAVRDHRPDIALVDVHLPDGSGIELIRDLRARTDLRCVVLTAVANDEAFFQAVVAGAHGYLVKDVGPAELSAALHRVAAGESLINREVIDELRRRSRQQPPDDVLLKDLTGQERRILMMVAEGLTNRQVALELGLAEKTIRNYVSTILAKVGLANRTQLAVFVAMRRPRS